MSFLLEIFWICVEPFFFGRKDLRFLCFLSGEQTHRAMGSGK